MARISVKDREVYCIELERFDTIGNFAAELGLGKVYYISTVVDKPNRTAGYEFNVWFDEVVLRTN